MSALWKMGRVPSPLRLLLCRAAAAWGTPDAVAGLPVLVLLPAYAASPFTVTMEQADSLDAAAQA